MAADPAVPVVVRLATLADVDGIVVVHTLARSAYYRAGGLTEDEYDTPDGTQFRREGWASAIASPEKRVVCAVRAGTIVGAAAMGPPYAEPGEPAASAEPIEPGVGQLLQIHVHPDHWGQGVGSLLHAAFVTYLRDSGLSTGQLEAWERNTRGHRFYARHGWRPDGRSQPGPRDTRYLQLRLDLDRLPG